MPSSCWAEAAYIVGDDFNCFLNIRIGCNLCVSWGMNEYNYKLVIESNAASIGQLISSTEDSEDYKTENLGGKKEKQKILKTYKGGQFN